MQETKIRVIPLHTFKIWTTSINISVEIIPIQIISSNGRPSIIDGKHYSRDSRGLVASKKDNCVGDIFRFSFHALQTTSNMAFDEGPCLLLVRTTTPWCKKKSTAYEEQEEKRRRRSLWVWKEFLTCKLQNQVGWNQLCWSLCLWQHLGKFHVSSFHEDWYGLFQGRRGTYHLD